MYTFKISLLRYHRVIIIILCTHEAATLLNPIKVLQHSAITSNKNLLPCNTKPL